MPEFYMKIARKYFPDFYFFFGGGARAHAHAQAWTVPNAKNSH